MGVRAVECVLFSETMKIAIVHYHLRTGGVTRVVRHAFDAPTGSDVAVAVLSGEPPAEPMPSGARVEIVPELAYESAFAGDPRAAAEILQAAATKALGGSPDVWHIHNHALGKNRFLPMATAGLAERGCRLLLQIHDFAEDGRPENYRFLLRHVGENDEKTLARRLYPAAPTVHYAALNERDRRFLASAGAQPDHLHLLPNAVALETPPAEWRELSGGSRRVLYPTRGIRRKNLGEFILWAALHSDDRFGVTRRPLNPAARAIHDRWAAFAEKTHGVRVAFDMAAHSPAGFFELMAQADALATTSVAEGFGLCFLEPWAVGRPLLGRNLPEITAGITANGVDLSGMYERLDVPADWVGEDVLRRRIEEGLREHYTSYGRTLQPGGVRRAYDAFVRDGMVDFGRLDEPLQERVIERLVSGPAAREAVRPRNLAVSPGARERTARNREALLRSFSIPEYGKRLRGVYDAVAASPSGVIASLSRRALLDDFLDPARFNLMLTHT